jgi:subtilisin family serine protease
MKAYGETTPADPAPPQRAPSEELRIAVTFKGRGNFSPARMQARLSAASVGDFAPVAGEVERAIEALKQKGFVVSGRGEMSLSVRGTREQFEQTFGTELSVMQMPLTMGYSESAVLYPAQGAPWQPDPALSELIDDAYIQWPHIYMGTARAANAETASSAKSTRATTSVGRSTRATPSSGRAAFAAGGPATKKAPTRKVPKTKVGLLSSEPPKRTAPCLDVLVDVPRLLNASPIHEQSVRGSGIRIAMIDTGFAHSHPFFVANGFTSSVMLAPGATHRETDPGSHGTGESANIFAIAPQVSFIGIKLENDDDSNGGASILEGFQEALRHDPHVISVSMGYDLRDPDGRSPLAQLPNGLKALEMEIQAAVAKGIVVVFSAGNGHYSFPGQMPEVISAGGVYLDEQGRLVASDYASAFVSRIYSGRTVPDICGLVGPLPHADYIMLPIPPESSLDLSCAAFDGTKPDDGWAVFSGTSAAAPQIAAICALLRQKNSALAPAAIKALLERTALDVRRGHANPASDPAGKGLPATPARDGATGAGLVDAFAAWNQA